MAGGDEAVLQTGVFVVDLAQRDQLAHGRIALPAQPIEHRAVGIATHATGDHAVHHQAVAEGLQRQPLPVFAQARELGQPETQRGIVAERAEVAEVIRDPFALEQQRTQPMRPRWDRTGGRGLEGHAVGPGTGHRRVARDPARQAVRLERRQLREAAVDALVRVAQVLFEPQHLLADDREAKMPRLDDARVHRANGDLVHAVAFDTHEGVVRWHVGVRRGRCPGVVAQRVIVRRPEPVVEPGARVGRAFGDDPQQVRRRALHAAGGGKDRGEVGAGRCRARQWQFEPGQPVLQGIGRTGDEAATAVAAVHTPGRYQAPASVCDRAGSG